MKKRFTRMSAVCLIMLMLCIANGFAKVKPSNGFPQTETDNIVDNEKEHK